MNKFSKKDYVNKRMEIELNELDEDISREEGLKIISWMKVEFEKEYDEDRCWEGV